MRHGEGEAGQQTDPFQPAAGSCGSALPHVKPQEHGEHPQTCPGSPNMDHQTKDSSGFWNQQRLSSVS